MTRVFIKGQLVVNSDNDDYTRILMKQGWRELSEKELVSAGMVGYEDVVSPINTAVSPNGSITFTPPDLPELKDLKVIKLAEINTEYQKNIATLTPGYPDSEKLTFDKQEAEARAWLLDNTAHTPFIDALAAGRRMDKSELVQRIIAKADAFALASGSLTGQRQRYEDVLNAAKTPEDIDAIIPQYILPEIQ